MSYLLKKFKFIERKNRPGRPKKGEGKWGIMYSKEEFRKAGMKILAGNYTACLNCGDTKKKLSKAGYCRECWTMLFKPGLGK